MCDNKLFVGGLSWETTKEKLTEYFCRYGEITDCIIMMNPESGRSRGFGFLTFTDANVVQLILSKGPHQLDGRTIDPKACNERMAQKLKKESRWNYPKIFLGGLPPDINESVLHDYFSPFGEVVEVVIMYDQEKKKARGFGFLSFVNEESVDKAVAKHFVHINGKKVEVKRAEPRDETLKNGISMTSLNQSMAGYTHSANNTQTHSQSQLAGGHSMMAWGYPHASAVMSPVAGHNHHAHHGQGSRLSSHHASPAADPMHMNGVHPTHAHHPQLIAPPTVAAPPHPGYSYSMSAASPGWPQAAGYGAPVTHTPLPPPPTGAPPRPSGHSQPPPTPTATVTTGHLPPASNGLWGSAPPPGYPPHSTYQWSPGPSYMYPPQHSWQSHQHPYPYGTYSAMPYTGYASHAQVPSLPGSSVPTPNSTTNNGYACSPLGQQQQQNAAYNGITSNSSTNINNGAVSNTTISSNNSNNNKNHNNNVNNATSSNITTNTSVGNQQSNARNSPEPASTGSNNNSNQQSQPVYAQDACSYGPARYHQSTLQQPTDLLGTNGCSQMDANGLQMLMNIANYRPSAQSACHPYRRGNATLGLI